jgi:hypothetical protein
MWCSVAPRARAKGRKSAVPVDVRPANAYIVNVPARLGRAGQIAFHTWYQGSVRTFPRAAGIAYKMANLAKEDQNQ